MIRFAFAILGWLPGVLLAGTISTYDPDWSPIGAFSPNTRCDNCHAATDPGVSPAVMRSPSAMDPATPDPNGRDLSPLAGERANLMGHALNDPYFQATVEDEVERFADLAGEIEDSCLTCHAPMGHNQAHLSGVGLDGDGFYRMQQAMDDMHARAGVSCTFCHQMEPDMIGDPGNGSYLIRDDLTLLGPYPDPDRTSMAGYSVEEGDTSQRIRRSEFCGACHNLTTQVVDVTTGLITGAEFLEQGTWFEWRNSSYGGPIGDPGRTNCHVCHMPQPTPSYATAVATSGSPPLRTSFGSHELAGGNTHILTMLADNAAALGLDPGLTRSEFDQAVASTQALLQSAASVDLQASTLTGAIEIAALITNLSGHKLPSGFPSRRMWLHLEVRNGSGQLVFDSGHPDAQGRLSRDSDFTQAGCLAVSKPPGFDNSPCYEPHRDVITDPSQVSLYESVLADSQGDITHVLLHAASYLKDNRLPPLGFSDTSPVFVPATAPVGVAGDADFHLADGGTDRVRYQVDTSGEVGPFQVTAQLLYQSIRPSFVAGLLTTGNRVNEFKTYYANLPPPVEQITAAQVVINGDELVFRDSFE